MLRTKPSVTVGLVPRYLSIAFACEDAERLGTARILARVRVDGKDLCNVALQKEYFCQVRV